MYLHSMFIATDTDPGIVVSVTIILHYCPDCNHIDVVAPRYQSDKVMWCYVLCVLMCVLGTCVVCMVGILTL